MKLSIKLFYLFIILIMIFLILLEYNHQITIFSKVNTSDYLNKIMNIKEKLDVIEEYKNESNNKTLKESINICINNNKFLNHLDKDELSFYDINDFHSIANNCIFWNYNSNENIKILESQYSYDNKIKDIEFFNLIIEYDINAFFKENLNRLDEELGIYIEILKLIMGDEDV